MQLTARVHLVGSGRLGFDLTNPYDCHVYLVDGGAELALIDAGVGLATEAILANVAAAGFDLGRLRTVVLTHAHADHAGGAAGVRARTGAQVVTPRAAAPWIEAGDEAAISLDVARRAGTYPADYRFAACPVARGVVAGDAITVGDMTLRVLDTPGHCDPHCAYVIEGDDRGGVFAGDAVFHGGRVLFLNIPGGSIQALAASMAKLDRLQADALFPGHGLISVQRGWEHVRRAADAFARLAIPPSLL
ncbi:MAG: MBL fold metallo-hydrolase [Actinobacteria bacterium]|nr:MBL fold metallo-hydrolase [Actinomycetota bacterium]